MAVKYKDAAPAQDVDASKITEGHKSVLEQQHHGIALFLHFPLDTWSGSVAETG